GDVGEVHGQGLPADVGRLRVSAAEVHVLHEKVGGGEQELTRLGCEDGAIVTDAHPHVGPLASGRFTDEPDERELAALGGHGTEAAEAGPTRGEAGSSRKFRSRRLPSRVRMDSGWNCTPSMR